VPEKPAVHVTTLLLGHCIYEHSVLLQDDCAFGNHLAKALAFTICAAEASIGYRCVKRPAQALGDGTGWNKERETDSQMVLLVSQMYAIYGYRIVWC
jgi:hypothetical protein